jgi:hypothetical protein
LLVDPGEVLAVTLDLAGSMEIEGHLADAAHVASAAPVDPEALDVIRRDFSERYQRLASSVMRRLADLPTGRSRIAEAPRLFETLTRRDALARRNGRVIGAVAKECCESYLLVVGNLLERIRGEARGFRAELGAELGAMGGRASELETFDALLGRACFRFSTRLFARIPPALAEDFAERLREAVAELPENAEQEDLSSWYAKDGWVREYQDQVARVLRAVMDHEREALLGLLEAAAEAPGSHQQVDAR